MTETLAPIINFSVVVLILWYFGRKPLSNMWQERSQSIEGQINAAAIAAREMNSQLEIWSKKQASLPSEIQALSADARESLNRTRTEQMAQLAAELERIERDNQLAKESETQKAKKRVFRKFAESSVQLARTRIQGGLNNKSREALVNDFLRNLGSP